RDGCEAWQHGFGEPIEIGVPPQPLLGRKAYAQIRIPLMAPHEYSEHVLPIAGCRKCERCVLRDLDLVVEYFIMQLCRHLTPFKQCQWLDEITQCESEIAAMTIGTDERADVPLDVARAP